MSIQASSESSNELAIKSNNQRGGSTSKPANESPATDQSKSDSNRKKRRLEWYKKSLAIPEDTRSKNPPPSQGGSENSQENRSEQIAKLRNRQTISKPDSLQYEPNLNRGFHAKILHTLYNGSMKKKKEEESAKHSKGKRKRKSNSSHTASREQIDAKKPKTNTAPPAPQPTEYFDSYTFSMNLINGEVEKVKAQQADKGKDSKNKYVLFIGNLPHEVTREQLEEHFRKTGGIKAIRIPREKGNDKGKGYAYMEFDSRISHGIALRLHQTTLGGRKINVEFTSIGGGKSLSRRDKLKMKNMKRRKMKRH